jgi:hypothetical protein
MPVRKDPAPSEILLSLHLRILLQLLCYCFMAPDHPVSTAICRLARISRFGLLPGLDRQYLHEPFFPYPHRSEQAQRGRVKKGRAIGSPAKPGAGLTRSMHPRRPLSIRPENPYGPPAPPKRLLLKGNGCLHHCPVKLSAV